MFAYCGNNSVNREDPSGYFPSKQFSYICFDNGSEYPKPKRDVTIELGNALEQAAIEIQEEKLAWTFLWGDTAMAQAFIWYGFYLRVNHAAPWDIKRKECWEQTIGTEFPGKNHGVLVGGMTMTPENIGNFTYGILGYLYDIPLDALIAGSWYAAGFPTDGEKLHNEIFDWHFVILGYQTVEQANKKG